MGKIAKDRLYCNPDYIYLSGREIRILKKYNDGSMLVLFPTFGNEKKDNTSE